MPHPIAPTFIALLTCAIVLPATRAAPPADSPPWVSLFNGRDLSGWKLVGDKGRAEVRDGAIICRQMPQTREHTFVCSEQRYADFILELECRIDGNFNTGVLLRCVEAPPEARVRLHGFQVKIDPLNTKLDPKSRQPPPRRWTGGVFDDFGNTWQWLHTLEHDPRARAAFNYNDWNRLRIEALGTVLKVWVNDVPTTHLQCAKYARGFVALKIHSLAAQSPEQEKYRGNFRSIRIITEDPGRYARPIDLPLTTVP